MNINTKQFIIAEALYVGSTGLILPLIAVFISGNILYGSIVSAGIGITIYTLTKSIIRIPISKYCDKRRLHKKYMIIGYFVMAIIPAGYYFMQNVYQYYALQTIAGFGAAIGRAGWYGLFSKNIEKNKEAYTWGVMQTATGFAEAMTAVLGGLTAAVFGFRILFLIATVLSLLSVILLINIDV